MLLQEDLKNAKGKFMVIVVGGSAPTVVHDDIRDAEREASRLINKTGRDAMVVRLTSYFRPIRIQKVF